MRLPARGGKLEVASFAARGGAGLWSTSFARRAGFHLSHRAGLSCRPHSALKSFLVHVFTISGAVVRDDGQKGFKSGFASVRRRLDDIEHTAPARRFRGAGGRLSRWLTDLHSSELQTAASSHDHRPLRHVRSPSASDDIQSLLAVPKGCACTRRPPLPAAMTLGA